MEKIKAPFTKEQVENLNNYQNSGRFHPFTCDSDAKECKKKSEGGELIATESGWVCPCGAYTQDWAHSFMAEPLPPDPFSKILNGQED